MRIILLSLLAMLLLFGCTTELKADDNTSSNTVPTIQSVNNSNATQTTESNLASLPVNTTVNKSTGNNGSTSNKTFDFSRAYSDNGKLIVYFFYSAKCSACQSIAPYVEGIGKKFENSTEWHGYNIDEKNERDAYLQFFKDMNLGQNRSGVPVMLINNTVLWGKYEINDSLEQVINSSITR